MPAQIAVLVPCHNEASSIAKVVADFKQALPTAEIHVFDNCSADGTADIARASGATVHYVALKGKGNVVRRMFADVEADIYLMVDGDDTYEAKAAENLVRVLLENRLDMVVGARVAGNATAAYRKGHQFGNAMLTGFVQRIFGGTFKDMLSGYRVFSRRFVKSFPAISHGFEIETELTIHALELRCPSAEIDTDYGARAEGSFSKLSTYRDGVRITKMIALMYKHERPLEFYGAFAVAFSLLSVVLAFPIIAQFVETGLVPRLPTAVLSASLMIAALISLACGLILGTVTKGRNEAKSLAYLSYPQASSILPLK